MERKIYDKAAPTRELTKNSSNIIMIPCHIFVGVESVEHEVARNHCLLKKNESTHTDPVIKPLYKIYVMFPKSFFAKKSLTEKLH